MKFSGPVELRDKEFAGKLQNGVEESTVRRATRSPIINGPEMPPGTIARRLADSIVFSEKAGSGRKTAHPSAEIWFTGFD